MIGGIGSQQTQSLLNKTLAYIISLLDSYEVTDWFLGYGTLLGIVRNNSCIKGDDDIDFIINRKYRSTLELIAKDHAIK